jgi:hypothetical protein
VRRLELLEGGALKLIPGTQPGDLRGGGQTTVSCTSLLLASTLLWTLAVSAQEPAQPAASSNQDPFVQATFEDFRLRAVGPAIASGRVGSIAVHPENKQTWYIGVSSGGVWKTTNAGITFTPVFQNEGGYAIGTVVIDPKNPSTLWVGTGEANNQRAVGYGDGVYRSDDAGKTWRNLGLKTSEQIGRIVIDPRDTRVVWGCRVRIAVERGRRTRAVQVDRRRDIVEPRAGDQREHRHQRRRARSEQS